MDTKLKKWKSIISFAAFVTAVSILLYDGISLSYRLGPAFWRWPGKIAEACRGDFQNTGSFRQEMSNYLENFISMAVGGPVWGWDYSGVSQEDTEALIQEGLAKEKEAEAAGIPYIWEEDYGYSSYSNPEENKKAADWYHEQRKGNKNLLYQISYDNRLLYDNTEGLKLDGPKGLLPDGYNFLLYFNGETVTIVKDGKEQDIYGDGYYEEGKDWYLPGYRNFSVDEKTKKAAVCLAVSARPVLYVNNNYEKGNGRGQEGDSLYWLSLGRKQVKEDLTVWGIMAAIALICLAVCIVLRKDRKKAVRFLAGGIGKVWIEGKLLVFAGIILLFLSQFSYQFRELAMMWSMEQQAYPYIIRDYIEQLGSRPGGLVILFWALYLLAIDFRYNKKTWRHGLTGKAAAAFRTAGFNQSFQKGMIRSFLPVFISGLILAILAAAAVAISAKGAFTPWLLLCILAIMGLLAAWLFYAGRNRRLAEDMGLLIDQIAAVRNGNLEHALALPAESGLSEAAENLNEIQKGMDKAVEEKIKSESMKVELVSNVSHDLKTPLTSIISYVDLLKEEDNLPASVQDYIEILDQKSQRLKDMVQDVFEVSKAASGQLPVTLEKLDFGKLLRQTLADMAERIESSSVTVKTQLPEDCILIEADGQRLYRVFQNLLQNALQYSLEGSRVYVALQMEGDCAAASVKNTSRQEISGEKDYTERFARGDTSRSDGGSGLGLSIARSFTEACGGTFRVETIADLFAVTVGFEAVS